MNSLPDDPRFGEILNDDVETATAGDIIILGVPTDEGILRNGGRVGATQAPSEIRRYLRRLTLPTSLLGESPIRIFDHPEIGGTTLEERHEQARSLTEKFSNRGCFVVGLGGGHDVAYPLVGGLCKTIGPIGLINVDAHFDVRPKKNGLHHSGSSFRLLIDENIIDPKRFIEFGIQSLSAAASHANWITQHGGTIYHYDFIRAQGVRSSFEEAISNLGDFYLSFDIDAIRASDAPGCSAPTPSGFFAEDALDLCRVAAGSGRLRGFDVVEVNPLFDIDGRTARLAALMVANLIATLSTQTR